MSAQVLLHKRTGELLEAHAVWTQGATDETIAGMAGWSISFRPTEPAGWILRHPDSTGYWFVFFNQKTIASDFENLGPLEDE